MKNILVVMPFTLPWSEPVWDILQRIALDDISKQLNIYRVDMTKVLEDDLDKQIENENRKADVILADITEQNPNVLIEVGFALAQKKPLLIITQDRRWISAHLKGRIIETYNFDDPDSLQFLKTVLRTRIKDKLEVVEARQTNHMSDIKYQVDCYAHRAMVGLENHFKNAEKRIDILTTNLAFLFEEYSENGRCYFDEIERALNKEASKTKVRILTLDPESDFAAKRGRQLGFAPAVFRDNLRDALKKTMDRAAKYGTRVEVRIYDDFPTQITYRIDNHIINCLVAQPTASRNHLTFSLDRRQSGVDNSFITHFQNIWGHANSP